MDWHDSGIVLGGQVHGEYDLRLELLTEDHGRVFGIVKGGQSRRLRGALQPGNRIEATWRARIETQLGTFAVEPKSAHSLALARDPGRLAALVSCLAITATTLPEREVHRPVHDGLAGVIDLLDASAEDDAARLLWGTGIVRWELGLLRDLGFGLDLGACAATGQAEDLCYVSPRTGRAVSLGAGAPYRDRLLTLPPFLTRAGEAADGLKAVADGLALTAFFIDRCLLAPHGREMPAARLRLSEYVAGARMRDINSPKI